jgi:hypothetical protein
VLHSHFQKPPKHHSPNWVTCFRKCMSSCSGLSEISRFFTAERKANSVTYSPSESSWWKDILKEKKNMFWKRKYIKLVQKQE